MWWGRSKCAGGETLLDRAREPWPFQAGFGVSVSRGDGGDAEGEEGFGGEGYGFVVAVDDGFIVF